ncbi:MAG: glycerate kinase, partial [Nocardioides sp.]|uniref:glycerate kinase n=1 Tax=Nocardioides sp. TaxID=35761 RepID=UPI0039E2258F
MRIVVAPDKFAGTLTAPQAAAAIAAGWKRADPTAELIELPMADGGPGFVDVLHAGVGGRLVPVQVSGPFGEPVTARLLLDGTTAYVEAAQACGLVLTGGRTPERASTYGVGELVLAARAAGATRIVVGLGGS